MLQAWHVIDLVPYSMCVHIHVKPVLRLLNDVPRHQIGFTYTNYNGAVGNLVTTCNMQYVALAPQLSPIH